MSDGQLDKGFKTTGLSTNLPYSRIATLRRYAAVGQILLLYNMRRVRLF